MRHDGNATHARRRLAAISGNRPQVSGNRSVNQVVIFSSEENRSRNREDVQGHRSLGKPSRNTPIARDCSSSAKAATIRFCATTSSSCRKRGERRTLPPRIPRAQSRYSGSRQSGQDSGTGQVEVFVTDSETRTPVNSPLKRFIEGPARAFSATRPRQPDLRRSGQECRRSAQRSEGSPRLAVRRPRCPRSCSLS